MSMTLTTGWVVETCCREGCHMQWAMPKRTVEDLQRTHEFFCCPNGHSQHYTAKSDVEIAREQRDKSRREVTQLHARLDQALAAKHEAQERAARAPEHGRDARLDHSTQAPHCQWRLPVL